MPRLNDAEGRRLIAKLRRGESLTPTERDYLEKCLTPLLRAVVRKVVWRHDLEWQEYAERLGEGFQVAYVTALAVLPVYDPERKGRAEPATFVSRCARNRLLDWVRRQERARSTEFGAPEAIAHERSPEVGTNEDEARARLAAAISELSLREQELFSRRSEGDTFAAIATDLGLTAGAARSAFHRVMRKLRARLRTSD